MYSFLTARIKPATLTAQLVICTAAFSCISTVFAQSPGFFRTSGAAILDPAGNPVVLRGVGLGGWLMPEGYMLHIAAPDGGSPRSIRSQIENLIGVQDADRFYEIYQAKYVQEKDIATIASWGFDHIRLPFHYKLFFDPATETFLEDGFALLDTFLSWCRTYGIFVILDMHATPGAQNSLNISDSDGIARLWTEPVPYQDQTVAIWTEIARRYANDTLIIGYDLINEPVTPNGVSGFDLRALYMRLAKAIRTVDTNHILFIEGNFFATHFPELIPPFDVNMVYAFHKYWNGTQINSIQYLLDIRAQNNVPLWLGESGENSNTWFHAVTRLMEQHAIGWNWWTHKKIETTTSPLSAPFAPGYENVLNYWRGSGPRPTAGAARTALFAMAEGLDLDSCALRPDVLAALFNPDYATLRAPFKNHQIPGHVNAVDYDLGDHGTTYWDSDVMATTGSPGGGNNGGKYRNDGVDIESSTDPEGYAYNVGWINRDEWLTYTVNIQTAGTYDLEIRVASDVGGGRFKVLIDDLQIGSDLTVGNTGGWQSWTSVWLRDVSLPAGQHNLALLIVAGDFNLNRMRFTLLSGSNTGGRQGKGMLGSYPNPAFDGAQVAFYVDAAVRARLEVFDILGRMVFDQPWQSFAAGTHALTVRAELSSGLYVYRLSLDDGVELQSFTSSMVVFR